MDDIRFKLYFRNSKDERGLINSDIKLDDVIK